MSAFSEVCCIFTNIYFGYNGLTVVCCIFQRIVGGLDTILHTYVG